MDALDLVQLVSAAPAPALAALLWWELRAWRRDLGAELHRLGEGVALLLDRTARPSSAEVSSRAP